MSERSSSAYINLLRDEIKRLSREIERLKSGRFTPEEFQNLCHDLNAADKLAFLDGCHDYQRKLFGVSDRDMLKGQLTEQRLEIERLLREIKAARKSLNKYLYHLEHRHSQVGEALDCLDRAIENNPRQMQPLASDSKNHEQTTQNQP